jgi:hypothetical protein
MVSIASFPRRSTEINLYYHDPFSLDVAIQPYNKKTVINKAKKSIPFFIKLPLSDEKKALQIWGVAFSRPYHDLFVIF